MVRTVPTLFQPVSGSLERLTALIFLVIMAAVPTFQPKHRSGVRYYCTLISLLFLFLVGTVEQIEKGPMPYGFLPFQPRSNVFQPVPDFGG